MLFKRLIKSFGLILTSETEEHQEDQGLSGNYDPNIFILRRGLCPGAGLGYIPIGRNYFDNAIIT